MKISLSSRGRRQSEHTSENCDGDELEFGLDDGKNTLRGEAERLEMMEIWLLVRRRPSRQSLFGGAHGFLDFLDFMGRFRSRQQAVGGEAVASGSEGLDLEPPEALIDLRLR
eukprot:1351347-Amorphochlora_amoeboformis.AAC.1